MFFIDEIVQSIIRPSRQLYHLKRLGEKFIQIKSQLNQNILLYSRDDEILKNEAEQQIHLSYYHCQYNPSNSCVIYLHANSGSRIEGLPYLYRLLSQQLNVCVFDCSGSGLSEGEYVTLGLNEANDLKCVISYLKTKNISKVILWGRSMGAVTALIYASRNEGMVGGLILDSPFQNLETVVKEVASLRTGLPKFLFEPILYLVRNKIKEMAHFNLEQLNMSQYIESQLLKSIPALFLVSKKDTFVASSHGESLFKSYKCSNKHIQNIQIDHHQNRGSRVINFCLKFISHILHPLSNQSYQYYFNPPKSLNAAKISLSMYAHQNKEAENQIKKKQGNYTHSQESKRSHCISESYLQHNY